MENLSSYEIRTDSKGAYIFIKSKSVISLQDKSDLLDKIAQDSSLPRNLRVIDDATGSKLTFNISGVRKLMQKATQAASGYDSIKYAVILNTALYVAYVIFADTISANSKFNIKVFPGFKEAQIWLNR